LDYENHTLNISIPGYIIKQLQKYKHDSPSCPQYYPYYPQQKQYGSVAQRLLPPNNPPPTFDRRNKTRTTGHREHPVLCKSG
jgi:hypothetical protein